MRTEFPAVVVVAVASTPKPVTTTLARLHDSIQFPMVMLGASAVSERLTATDQFRRRT